MSYLWTQMTLLTIAPIINLSFFLIASSFASKNKRNGTIPHALYFISWTSHLRFPVHNVLWRTTHSFRNPMTSLLFRDSFNVFYFGSQQVHGGRPFLFTVDERKRKFVFKWPKLFRCNLIMLLLEGERRRVAATDLLSSRYCWDF